jgi:hypothetical protein
LVAAAGGIAHAQHEGGPVSRPAPPRPARYSPPGTHCFDGFINVQVNVGPGGQNILGDAANEPSIAVDPTAPNRIVIGWRQFDSIASNFREAGRGWSNDGGRTWHFAGVLDNGIFRSDPVLRADNEGRIFYYSLKVENGNQYTCQMFVSTDGGQTFGQPLAAYGGDKAWFAIDRTNLSSSGFIYAAWDYASVFTPNGFTRSISHSASYSIPVPMPTSPNWGTMAVGPDGEVYVCGNRDGVQSQFTMIKSTDAASPPLGPTFPLSHTVSLGGSQVYFTQNTPNPGGLMGQIYIDVDTSSGPSRGYVYMFASVNPPGSDPMDVMIARSTDGGQTWGTPVKVNDERLGANAWQWFGAMDVAPNGRIDAIWLDTEYTGVFNRSELRYSFSTDAGATWAPSQAAGDQFDSLIGWPDQNKIGDYIDIESDLVGANVAYSATFNGEQDVYYVRIGDRDCNSNGIPDMADLASGVLHDCDANGIPDECEIAAGVIVSCFCYANCDGSTTPPVLNINDFVCFQQQFAAGATYANCDGSTTPPILNVNDFVCFQQQFAAGCP